MSVKLSPKHGVNPMLGQCLLCGGDTNELFLVGRLPGDEEAPRRGVVPGMSRPCDTCQGLMQQGILLIICQDGSDQANPYRTGEMHVIKEEAAAKIFNNPDVLRKRAAFIEESVARAIGIPKPEPKKE